jgi:hypothetical protein
MWQLVTLIVLVVVSVVLLFRAAAKAQTLEPPSNGASSNDMSDPGWMAQTWSSGEPNQASGHDSGASHGSHGGSFDGGGHGGGGFDGGGGHGGH